MSKVLKRTIDIVGSAVGLVLLLPAFAVVAAVIKLDSEGPVFFRQTRIGRNGRPFRIFKFRTMGVRAPQTGPALTVREDRRITAIGKFLRHSKIDELPQLINVLAGDMSLVGPRPEVAEFMKFYTPEQRATILAMRPGMTDYAAILFRDESSLLDQGVDPVSIYRHYIMPIKFAYYERYSRETGLMNDLRIVIGTILLLVLKRIPASLGIESKLRTLTLQSENAAEASL